MTTRESMSLDQFAEEMREQLEAFVADYKRHHADNPEHYPLVLDGDNTGLWFEFFTEFSQADEQPSISDSP